MDDSATGHATDCPVTALDDVFTKWFITHRLWFLRSSGLNPHNYDILETP